MILMSCATLILNILCNLSQPFYGGKLHRVTAEVKNSSGATLTRVQGEWDSVLEFSYANGGQEVGAPVFAHY